MVGHKGLTIFDIGDPTLKLDWQFATDRAFAVRRGPTPTFTRSTVATYEDSTGVIRTAAVNEPRIDFDPTTLACSGLLLEEARTNLFTWSEDATQTSWFKSGTTASANQTVAPDGATAADLVAETTANAQHFIRIANGVAVTDTTTYTGSVFLKKGTGSTAPDWVVMQSGWANFSKSFAFNLTTGAVGATFGSPSYTIKQYPNGWWRVSFTAASVGTNNNGYLLLFFSNNTNVTVGPTYAGQTTSDIFIWGAQFEAGAFPTSYIPTTTASVPRGADVLEITGANFSNFWNQPEGALVLEMQKAYSVTSAIAQINYLSVNDGTGLNYLQFAQRGQGVSGEVFRVELGGTSQVLMAAGAASGAAGPINATNTPFRLGGAYKANDFAAAINGSDCGIDTTGSIPTLTQLNFVTVTSANHIRSLQYYSVRKTNAELTRLTQLSTLDPALTLDLQFALDATYFSRRGPTPTFTRASSARFVGPTGLIQVASTNVPRLDYDPITLQPLGLLIEEQRANLTAWSEDVTNALWSKGGTGATGNTTVAPDGNSSADTLTEAAVSAQHYAYSPPGSVTSGTTYTASVFLKKGSGATAPDWVAVGFLSAGFGSKGIAFNVSTGAFGVANGSLVGTAKQYPNGWWRVSFTAAAVSAGTHAAVYIGFTNNTNTAGTPTYVGQTTSDIFIWGAQFEAGSFASSYIPTTATVPVPRSADVCSILGAAFTGFYNATEGTMVCKYDRPSALSESHMTIDNGTSNERLVLQFSSLVERFGQTNAGGGTGANLDASFAGAINTRIGHAARYKLNDFAFCCNGTAVVTNTTLTVPNVNQLTIGNRLGGIYTNGHIHTIQYFNAIKTNAQLQALSTP